MERFVLTLTACGLMFTCAAVNAQARGPSAVKATVELDEAEVAAARVAQLEQLDTWLRRLAGRFDFSGEISGDSESTCDRARRDFARLHSNGSLGCRGGSIPPPPVKISGNADCVGISSGAGVHCVIQLDWQVPVARYGYGYSPAYRASWFNPGIILYGIDPNALGIRFLQVSQRSIAESALGVLEDNTVTFKLPGPYSSRKVQITALPDSDNLEMRVIEDFGDAHAFYRFLLKRMPP
jgi:hypothetical protein